MAKRKMDSSGAETFGERLARFRIQAGLSQRDLALEVGISQRMVAYYEKQTDYPPAHLLPALTRVLSVSADELLGLENAKERKASKDSRLWRRFQKIEKLGPKEKKQVIQILDTFIEREQLRERAAGKRRPREQIAS